MTSDYLQQPTRRAIELKLLVALQAARPYVQKVAETAPTEPQRIARQRAAVATLATIDETIAEAKKAAA